MSNRRQVTHKGTNSQGNEYTSYDDGAYRYKNVDHESGKTQSSFYDTNQGHAFFKKNGSDGYKFHENQNQGYRDYESNQKPVSEGKNAYGNDYKQYADGSYRYNNKDSSGKTSSNFYDDGKGGSHFRKSDYRQ